MRSSTRVAIGTSLLAATLTLAGTASAQSTTAPTSPVVGHAYVDDNTLGANTVAAFDRHADGSLTPIPGSPFAVGGAGLGHGLGSQGAIQVTADRRFLLAVDAGSNQISVLRLDRRGVPTLLGAPVASGGVEPVSVAVTGDGLVYVANVGTAGSDYAGFRLHRDGALTPIPGSAVAVPEGSGVGDVFFNPTGDHLVGTRDNTSLIDSFLVGDDGRLRAAAGSPFPAQSAGPIGSQFRPTNPSQLFVSNAHAGAGLGTVSAFRVSRSGRLTSIGGSPYADLQTAPCWVEISHDGKYLFAVNTGSGTVSAYGIARDGSLTLLATTPFKDGAGAADARLSDDGRTLLVTGGAARVVSTFAVTGPTLTELATSPATLPADSSPVGLAVL